MLFRELNYVFRVGFEIHPRTDCWGTLQLTMKLEDILIAKLKDELKVVDIYTAVSEFPTLDVLQERLRPRNF